MENNQNTPNKPPRQKRALIDMIIPALGILVIWRVDWANMNSFHYLIIFMFILALMLRWSNLRKMEAAKRKRAEYMAQKEARENGVPVQPAQPASERKPVIVFAEPAEEAPVAPAEETPAEEKTEV